MEGLLFGILRYSASKTRIKFPAMEDEIGSPKGIVKNFRRKKNETLS